MSPFGGSFARMAVYKDTHVCVETDATACDTTIFPEALMQIARLKVKLYEYDGDNEKKVLAYYKMLSCNFVIFPDNSVGFRSSGNPSGQSSTTTDNTLWSGFTNVYATIKVIMKVIAKPQYALKWYRDNVKIFAFGDDVLMLVALLAKLPPDFWDDYAMVAYMDLGVIFTLSTPRAITGCKWLNFHWASRGGRWYPALDNCKMINSLMLRVGDVTPSNTLERVVGMRNMAYGDLELFGFLTRFAAYMFATNQLDHLRVGLLTEPELDRLYHGTVLDWDRAAERRLLYDMIDQIGDLCAPIDA